MISADGAVPWTPEALGRLDNIPDFVRPMARQGIEHYARSKGYAEVDEAVLEQRRKQPGVFGSQNERGWLRVYQRTVLPVHKGAVLRR